MDLPFVAKSVRLSRWSVNPQRVMAICRTHISFKKKGKTQSGSKIEQTVLETSRNKKVDFWLGIRGIQRKKIASVARRCLCRQTTSTVAKRQSHSSRDDAVFSALIPTCLGSFLFLNFPAFSWHYFDFSCERYFPNFLHVKILCFWRILDGLSNADLFMHMPQC